MKGKDGTLVFISGGEEGFIRTSPEIMRRNNLSNCILRIKDYIGSDPRLSRIYGKTKKN